MGHSFSKLCCCTRDDALYHHPNEYSPYPPPPSTKFLQKVKPKPSPPPSTPTKSIHFSQPLSLSNPLPLSNQQQDNPHPNQCTAGSTNTQLDKVSPKQKQVTVKLDPYPHQHSDSDSDGQQEQQEHASYTSHSSCLTNTTSHTTQSSSTNNTTTTDSSVSSGEFVVLDRLCQQTVLSTAELLHLDQTRSILLQSSNYDLVSSLTLPIALRSKREALYLGDAVTQFEVAMLYHQGKEVKLDSETSRIFLTLSALQGYAPAQSKLAQFYYSGHDGLLPQGGNTTEALFWFEKASISEKEMEQEQEQGLGLGLGLEHNNNFSYNIRTENNSHSLSSKGNPNSNSNPNSNRNSNSANKQKKRWKTKKVETLFSNDSLTIESRKVVSSGDQSVNDLVWCKQQDQINVLVQLGEQDQFLVYRQAKYGIKGETLSTLSTFVERRETGEEAAQRKLAEEIGVQPGELVQLGKFAMDSNVGEGSVLCYLALFSEFNREKLVAPVDVDSQFLGFVRMSAQELSEALYAGQFKEIKWTATISLALKWMGEQSLLSMDKV